MNKETNKEMVMKRTLSPVPPRRGPAPNPILQMLVKEGNISKGHASMYLRGLRASYRLDVLMAKHGHDLPIYKEACKQ